MDYMDIGMYHALFFGSIAAAHLLVVLGWICYRYVNDSMPHFDEGAPWLKWFVSGDISDTICGSILIFPVVAALFWVAWPLCWFALFVFVFLKILRYIVRLKKRVDKYHPEEAPVK